MYRYTLNILLILPFLFILGLLTTHDTSALSYQSNTGVQFTINPTITLSVSGDLTINDLTPGNSNDSNIITVTTSSNAIAGYGLYSTVGNSSNPSTELRRNGTDTTNKFTSITENKPTLSDFTANSSTWGYSYCNGDNTICTTTSDNWVSGNTGSTLSGYNGLPLYDSSDDTAGIKLIDTSTSGSTTISFKIGAKASNSQIAGDYTNTINFIGIAKQNPTISMQEATLANCGETMYDTRDSNIYTTALINDQCWMTKNLNLSGGTTLSSADTNVPDDYSTTTAGFINGNTLPTSSTTGFSDDYTAYVYNSNSITCASNSPCYSYYSWRAATAGYNSIDGQVKYSICPKGWRLPTGSEYRALLNAFPTDAALISSPFLGTHAGGFYSGGSFEHGGTGGRYWPSTSYNNKTAYVVYIKQNPTIGYDVNNKHSGFSVRCILNN